MLQTGLSHEITFPVTAPARRFVFQVTAQDAQGIVGQGIHERAIIQTERFLAKAQKKLTP